MKSLYYSLLLHPECNHTMPPKLEGFAKIGVAILGVPTMKVIVFWGLDSSDHLSPEAQTPYLVVLQGPKSLPILF